MKEEIINHFDKLALISGLPLNKIERTFNLISSRITFIDDVLISDYELLNAIEIVSNVDENDALFVALTNHLQSKPMDR